MDPIWDKIVRESLQEALTALGERAVAGARFSQLVKRRADEAGLVFPPPPFKSFGAFINTFPTIVYPFWRLGKDMLIVPADQKELLLAEHPESNSNHIRDDLFEAFTQIPKHTKAPLPYYIRTEDKVVWLGPDLPKPKGAVEFPLATLDNELADRRAFIDSPEANLSKMPKAILAQALEGSSPLGAFSAALKQLGISHLWHRHRMGAIFKRLRDWSTEKQIPWSASWVADGVNKAEPPPFEQLATPIAPMIFSGRDLLAALANVVSDEDLVRITVPLDLVAKAWPKK